MNENSKNTMVTAIIVLVVLVAGIWIWQSSKKSTEPVSVTTPSPTPEPQTATTSPTSTPSSAPKPTAAYTKALSDYQYRIQFSDCHGIVNLTGTGVLSVKKGSKIMLDNRDPVAHTIAFKGVSVKVGAYSYAIVSANTAGTYPVTCDGGGAASLNVE